MTNLKGLLILALIYLLLFGSAEILYHRYKIQAEITRKYVHVLTGIIAMLLPFFFDSHWPVLILCSTFLIILLVTERLGILRSIHGIERGSKGSTIYPIVVYFCFLLYFLTHKIHLYYLPVMILAISDPIAALAGHLSKKGSFNQRPGKTIAGSLAFLVSTFVICGISLFWIEHRDITATVIFSVAVAIPVTIAEALTKKGYDNLTIPLTTVLAFYLINLFFG